MTDILSLATLVVYTGIMRMVEMFSRMSFSYQVVKRGGSNMDFWNIDLKLEGSVMWQSPELKRTSRYIVCYQRKA